MIRLLSFLAVWLAVLGAVLAGPTAAGPARAATPAPECSAAAPDSIARQVCESAALGELDRELGRVYRRALDSLRGGNAAGAPMELLKAEQLGWRRGLDSCLKAADRTACVTVAYLARIAELRAAYPAAGAETKDGISIGPVDFHCSDGSLARLTFFRGTTPLAWLQRAPDSYLLEIRLSGSGARYGADTGKGPVEFWNKGDAATLTLPGEKPLDCRTGGG
ncbi:Uncharacterized protein YPO0702 [Tistlia consotensis]|uniref:Uncharacterized protein YPO0702 n=1 Tax=Tistlia consotensis USBA 355 TaxID=560819 RepID=A0A1Y6BBS9_9PROT|nr:MliC family protein [Tistlia consotensis]SME92779.1 Uncharacterized protein YPO0702 [Tistlia consotensis USBA 355]SNR28220.1 Uncharacterized protein YPO0702 [Tistlia consotensis]